MKLNFQKLGNGQPIVILHGLFGASDNWLNIGKQLANEFLVYLVDQRNHGASPHSDVWNYQVMAQDVVDLIRDEQLSRIILMGHSMGGKTAMNLVATEPDLVKRLIVVDIGPKAYPVHHAQIIAGLKSVNLNEATSRKEVENQLVPYIPHIGVRQFLLKNLVREKNNTFRWKINLDVIDRNIEEVGKGQETSVRFKKPSLFLRGSTSDYIINEDADLINQIFPNSSIRTIDQAGHWIHAEKPKEFLEEVLSFINE